MTLPLTYEVMVDWDGTDWTSEPDFSQAIDNISNDVRAVSWVRGKEKEPGNAPAATLEIQLKSGLCSKYSPYNAAGPLFGKIRPWLITRVRAYHNVIFYNEFFGYISRITIQPHLEKQQVYIYVTDGMDLLARQLVSQNYDDRTPMSDGNAVNTVLDAAGWSATRRDIDLDGGSELFEYPVTGPY